MLHELFHAGHVGLLINPAQSNSDLNRWIYKQRSQNWTANPILEASNTPRLIRRLPPLSESKSVRCW